MSILFIVVHITYLADNDDWTFCCLYRRYLLYMEPFLLCLHSVSVYTHTQTIQIINNNQTKKWCKAYILYYYQCVCAYILLGIAAIYKYLSIEFGQWKSKVFPLSRADSLFFHIECELCICLPSFHSVELVPIFPKKVFYLYIIPHRLGCV